jgi:hypothetical protein
MKEIVAYKCGCGKVYVGKKACRLHEEVCTSWKHPKHRTCKTCIFGKQIADSNGMEHEPQFLHTWKQWKCSNPNFIYDVHFKSAHANAADLCINCHVWQNKKQVS